jgi:arylsulfatase A-like enzyme
MARRPHIVVVMTDQQKATAIDLYGGPVRTPNLGRLAADGLLYEHAFTPHPLCVPARVSFWTGRWPHSTGARTNEIPMPRTETHFAALLQEAGYTLGHFGKNHCFTGEDFDRYFTRVFEAGHGDRIGPGLTRVRSAPRPPAPPDSRRERGMRRPVARVRSEPPEQSATYLVTEEACRFLEEEGASPDEHPLALWVSIPDPHAPLQVPEPYASKYPPATVPLPPWREGELATKPERQQVFSRLLGYDDLREDDVRLAAGIYYGMIDLIDERVGTLLDTLERLGVREDTIVVFTSDHGDYLGEHHLLGKSSAFYDCLTRVPLLLSWPGHLPAAASGAGGAAEARSGGESGGSSGGAGRGERRPELVSTLDVIPTVLTLAGIPLPAGVQGRQLPGTPGAPAPREAIFAEYGAGGPPVRLAALDRLCPPGSAQPPNPLLREREGEGHGKMVRTRRWKYTHDASSTPGGHTAADELYDLESDPWELTNLAADPRYAAVVGEMRLHLLDWCLETENARPVPLYYDIEPLK